MNKALTVIALAAVLFLLLFAVLGYISRSDKAPGLLDGALSPCPDKPNCVCSEHRDDSAHFIEPLPIADTPVVVAMQKLEKIISALGGRLETSRENYIAATFSSSLFGFVDDVEARADADARVLHLRSASRIGHGDLGANRKRVEEIRRRFVDE